MDQFLESDPVTLNGFEPRFMLGARASATVAAETGTLPAFPNEFH